MRILIAHEAPAGGGGVESYLAALIPALLARGHHVAFLHYNPRAEQGPTSLLEAQIPAASVSDEGLDGALRRMGEWHPDVCFSHNMRALDVDERLAEAWPTVKMLHGYFGTCVGGQKAHAFPRTAPCSREFGPACLALYLPRRCGQLRPAAMFTQFAWASRQRKLLDAAYSHIVVASRHMAAEYTRHGVPQDRLTVAPLFPAEAVASIRPLPERPSVLFMGRMTAIKGGAVLAHAAAEARRISGIRLQVVYAGEGPDRPRLQQLTRSLEVDAHFPGWLTGTARAAALRAATLVAVPSLWPEPFGLVGLEAGAHGVPAVAFDVGGIREWLRDNENGRLVPPNDAGALARAIADLCSDPGGLARLGEGAQRTARRFSVDAHVATLERVFDLAASRRAAIA